MSFVGDLREASQDVVAPDLKAAVRGVEDLKEEVRSGNALLRDEMRNSTALLREEIQNGDALLRDEMRNSIALLREEIQNGDALLRDEMRNSDALLRREIKETRDQSRESIALLRSEIEQTREQSREENTLLREDTRQHTDLLRSELKASDTRAMERGEHLHNALQLALVMQRNTELEKQLEQLRRPAQPAQQPKQ